MNNTLATEQRFSRSHAPAWECIRTLSRSHIVAILDKFDALTHSLTEGLPREIALRQKQYEYYRDLLLSFPRPTPATPLEQAETRYG